MPEFDILKIKDSKNIRALLSDMVEQQREEKRVVVREFMIDEAGADDFDGDNGI